MKKCRSPIKLEVKEIKTQLSKGEEACGGEHTVEYTDDVLKSCTPEIY